MLDLDVNNLDEVDEEPHLHQYIGQDPSSHSQRNRRNLRPTYEDHHE